MSLPPPPKKKPFSQHCSVILPIGFTASHIDKVTEITESALKKQVVSVVFNPTDLSSNALL